MASARDEIVDAMNFIIMKAREITPWEGEKIFESGKIMDVMIAVDGGNTYKNNVIKELEAMIDSSQQEIVFVNDGGLF